MALSVSLSAFVCYFRAYRSYLSENKKCKQCSYILTFAIEWRHAKIVLRNLDLLLKISETVRVGAKKTYDDFCRFVYLTSKDNIAKIVLRDLDLHFEGNRFETLISLKGLVNAWCLFIGFDNCNWMAPLQKFHSMTLTYFIKVKYFKC